jgi:hypothetical protein
MRNRQPVSNTGGARGFPFEHRIQYFFLVSDLTVDRQQMHQLGDGRIFGCRLQRYFDVFGLENIRQPHKAKLHPGGCSGCYITPDTKVDRS